MNIALLKDLKLPEVKIPKGTVMMEKGSEGTRVFVLLSGGVEITVGSHLIAREHSPGTILGEISALLGTPIVATVTAMDDSVFYEIEDLIPFLRLNPEIAVNVAQTLAYRLAYMNAHFVEIRNHITTMQDKLSSYLPVFSVVTPNNQ